MRPGAAILKKEANASVRRPHCHPSRFVGWARPRAPVCANAMSAIDRCVSQRYPCVCVLTTKKKSMPHFAHHPLLKHGIFLTSIAQLLHSCCAGCQIRLETQLKLCSPTEACAHDSYVTVTTQLLHSYDTVTSQLRHGEPQLKPSTR